MRRNVAVARKTANAASKSAEATRNIIETFISTQRARLRIELGELKLPLDPNVPAHFVEYRVVYYGLTEARVIDSGMESVMTESLIPPNAENLSKIYGLPQIVTASTPLREKVQFLRAEGGAMSYKLTPQDVDGLANKRLFIHCRGFILYKDAFDRNRRTNFCYSWVVSDSPLKNRIPGISLDEWQRSGPPEANEES
jgi:hypothetical protein